MMLRKLKKWLRQRHLLMVVVWNVVVASAKNHW